MASIHSATLVERAASPNKINSSVTGSILRKKRIELKLDIERVAQFLCIRPDTIEAIENGAYDQLPPEPFSVGFVRSYSQYLGLDPDEMTKRFRSEFISSAKNHISETDIKTSNTMRQVKPNITFLWVLGLVVFVAYAAWYASVLYGENKAPQVEDAYNIDNGIVWMGADGTDSVVAPEQEEIIDTIGPQASKQVRIKALNDSWIEIRDSTGRVVISKVLRAGDEYEVPRKNGLKLMSGNAGGLVFVVGGEEFQSSKKRGSMLRDLLLDADALPKLLVPRK